MSLDSSLSEDLSNKMLSQTESASQTLFEYIHETLKSSGSSVKSNDFLSLVLQIYESFSNSTAETSPEQCGICGEHIPAKSRSFGSCPQGHVFRMPPSQTWLKLERCSITLLTLSTPCTCTCRICGRKKIDDSVFTEDREWCELVFAGRFKDIKGGIPEVEKCLCCDGEWIRKM